ncbi:MAG: hypothetical protein ACXVBE_14015 [Bdellovibrionota bacterium]
MDTKKVGASRPTIASQLLLIIIEPRMVKYLVSIWQNFNAMDNLPYDRCLNFWVIIPLI